MSRKAILAAAAGGRAVGFEDPASVAGLIGWWDAEDGITKDVSGCYYWQGKSPSANLLDQTGTVGARPAHAAADMNGHDVVRFDGTSDYMPVTAFDFERTDSFTLFFIIKPTSTVTGDHPISGNFDNGSGTGWHNFIYDERFYLVLDGAGAEQLSVKTTNVTVAQNGTYSLIITYDGSSNASGVAIYIDGSAPPLTTVTDTLASSIVTSGDYGIGRYASNYAAYFGGDIPQFGVYSRVITAPERTSLTDYLNTRYGL